MQAREMKKERKRRSDEKNARFFKWNFLVVAINVLRRDSFRFGSF
jgi:hypothetical protein